MLSYRVLILNDTGQTAGVHFAEFGDDRDACGYAHELLADRGCARVEVWRSDNRIYFADAKAKSA